MREKRVFLEDRIDRTLVSGDVVDYFVMKHDTTRIRRDKAADYTQGGGLAAARRTQQRDKFFVPDIKVYMVQNQIIVKADGNVSETEKHIAHPGISFQKKREFCHTRTHDKYTVFHRFCQ